MQVKKGNPESYFFRNWLKELEKAGLMKREDKFDAQNVVDVSDAVALSSVEDKSEYKPSLLKAILRTFGPWYAFLGIITFVEECVIRVFQPLFMGKLDQRILYTTF